MAAPRPSLSVVIPAYNEAERLPHSLPRVLAFLEHRGAAYEVLVVDDGSADGTAQVAADASCGRPAVRVLTVPHRGKAFAVRAGVLASRGERVLMTDADLSVPFELAARLERCLDEGYAIALGSREAPGAHRIGEPAYRHLMGRAFNRAVRLITGLPYADTQCGFKLFRGDAARAIFRRLRLYAEDAPAVAGPMVTGLDVEVLVLARRLGLTAREVGVEWHYRSGSKVRPLLDSYRMLKDVVRVRLNDARGRYRA